MTNEDKYTQHLNDVVRPSLIQLFKVGNYAGYDNYTIDTDINSILHKLINN